MASLTPDFSSPKSFIETYPSREGPGFELYRYKSSSHRFGFQWASKDLDVRMSHIRSNAFTFIYQGIEIGSLHGLRPSLVTIKAARFCRDKCATLALLKSKGVAVPASPSFAPDALGFDEARNHWLCVRDAYDVVMKPSHGSGGSGVTVGIESEAEFKAAWEEAAGLGLENRRVLVEEKIAGCDFRVVVVAGRAVCATTRVPAYVIGDGQQSLACLVLEKNRRRADHPYHKRSELALSTAHSAAEIPAPGRIVFLNNTANISTGGEAFDVTPYMPDEVRHLAEAACNAIPGLGAAGVDIISANQNPKVIEINTSPNYGMHYFPLHGQSRNPAWDVLSEMLKRSKAANSNRQREKAGAR